MSRPEPSALLDLATEAAAEAAALVLAMRAEGVDVAGTKSSPIDVVTEADHAAETLLRERLLGARPDDGLLGEEGDDTPGTSGVRWVVDPIDGTVNYLYGLPEYAVSVAAEVDGTVVAGVVHAPATRQVFTAALGSGSRLRVGDGEPRRLAVRPVVPLSLRLIGTGFNYVEDVRRAQAGYAAAMLPQVRDLRRRGSAALDLCAVGAGWSDGYVEEGTNPWDDSAGALVATEAGARFEVHRSAHDNRVSVCAPAGGYDDFLALCRSCGFVVQTTWTPRPHP